ncbi:MAG: hypothetical protein AAF579_18325 [Cyanobacteria bacterium P01_C01_bin.118]
MTALDIGREAQQAITLIKSFSLELNSYSPESQVLYWLNHYKAAWIRDAVIEAIYQGRYKIISVQHILSIWHRRGQPVRHFTSGFEQVMASHLGAPIHLPTDLASKPRRTNSYDSHLVKPSSEPLTMLYTAKPTGKNDTEEIAPNISNGAAGLIETFPVDDVNTLVEVYQANGTVSNPTPKTTMPASELKSLSFELPKPTRDPQEPLQQSKVHLPLVGSMPIQPFRPSLNQ